MAIVFTGHEFADGGTYIRKVLKEKDVRAGFFFTGDFYRNAANSSLISGLVEDGHYLGPHSDKHLLYCSWENRKKLLITKQEFESDILDNYEAMSKFGIAREEAPYLIPPYEWFNEQIAAWGNELGIVLVNFTPGTFSNADYTTPEMADYKSSAEIFSSIMDYEKREAAGLNGFILLLHIGVHPDRKDKFYGRLGELIEKLQHQGYSLVRLDELFDGRATGSAPLRYQVFFSTCLNFLSRGFARK